MCHGWLGIGTIFRLASGCNRPCSGILWTVKWYWNQLHLIMFHSLKTMLFLLFPCTWRIPYYRYAILSILTEFITTRPQVYVASSMEALFHYVPVIVSSWNFQELLPSTNVMSMQKVKVRGQRSRRSKTNFAPVWEFLDCTSSLNSPMAMKWCTKLEAA